MRTRLAVALWVVSCTASAAPPSLRGWHAGPLIWDQAECVRAAHAALQAGGFQHTQPFQDWHVSAWNESFHAAISCWPSGPATLVDLEVAGPNGSQQTTEILRILSGHMSAAMNNQTSSTGPPPTTRFPPTPGGNAPTSPTVQRPVAGAPGHGREVVRLQNGGDGTSFDSNNYRGKFFERSPTGTISQICAFGRDANTTVEVGLQPSPDSQALAIREVVQINTPKAWNCKSVAYQWAADSLFIYKLGGNGAVGYDSGKPTDSHYSSDGTAWRSDSWRRGYRVDFLQ